MIKHPVLEPKPVQCQQAGCLAAPQVWFKGVWVCMNHAEEGGISR